MRAMGAIEKSKEECRDLRSTSWVRDFWGDLRFAQVYLGVTVLLGLVTLAAGYVPARRAATLDPVEVLKAD